MKHRITLVAGTVAATASLLAAATAAGAATTGMRACRAGHFKPFNTKATGYEDNVVSWPSVEPASDYTANSTLAFVLAAATR
jgi:hypothetical protein